MFYIRSETPDKELWISPDLGRISEKFENAWPFKTWAEASDYSQNLSDDWQIVEGKAPSRPASIGAVENGGESS